MMYHKQKILSNVVAFSVFSGELFWVDKTASLFRECERLFACYGIEKNELALFCYSNLKQVETSLLFLNKERRHFPLGLMAQSFNGETVLAFDSKNAPNQPRKIGLLNIITHEIKWYLDLLSIGIYLRKNDILYYTQADWHLKAFCLSTGRQLWSQNLSASHIIKIVGSVDNKLIIICAKKHQNVTLVLDIDSGKPFWEAPGGNFFSALNEKRDTIVHAHINHSTSLKGTNHFQEMDIYTGKIKREGNLVHLDAVGLGIQTFILEKKFIYFTAHSEGAFATVVGVLDYENLHLQWWQKVTMEDADGFGNFLITSPSVSDMMLYVLDKTKTLHIFQRNPYFAALKKKQDGLQPLEYASPTLNTDDNDLPF